MTPVHRQYFYGGASVSLAIRIGGVGILFGANLLLARSLSLADYGLYAYTIELVALAAVVAGLGFDQIAVRVVPDFLAARQARALRAYIATGICVAISTAALIAGLLLVAFTNGAMPPTMSTGILGLAAILLLTLTMLRLAQESLRAAKRIALSQIIEQFCWPGVLAGMAGAAVLGWASPSLSSLLIAQIVVYGTATGVLLSILLRIGRHSAPPDAVAAENTAGWFSAGVPLALAAALSVFINRGDILALGTTVDAAELAPYTAASRYAALLVIGLAAASAVAAGVLRDCWRSGETENLQHAVDRCAGLSALLAGPLAIALIAFPEMFLELYGSAFVRGDTVLRLLASAQLINALLGPVALIVVVCEMERIYLMAMVGAVVLLVILLMMLIPAAGIEGAATSVVIALTLLNGILSLAIWRRTGIRSWATPRGVRAALSDLLGMLRFRRGSG